MSEQTASFKVTLVSGGLKREVRRFILLKSDLSSYSILRNKLKIVFQSIEKVPFKITWEDDDKDNILISSDEELMIAVKEMEGDVYRLTIETLETQSSENCNEVGSIHPMVICDECNGEVRGFRYTCVQCPNYDLCAKCEMSERHQEHFMVRIPHPIQWRPEFGRRLAHQMAKSAHKHRGQGSCGEERSRASARHCHSYQHHGCPAGQRDPQFPQVPQFLQHLFRNMWDQNAPQPEGREEGAAAAPGTERNRGGDEEGHVTYLRTIGETVASLLDPLGIDVNIEVETNKNKNGKCSSTETGDTSEQVNKKTERSGEKANEKTGGGEKGNKEKSPVDNAGSPVVDTTEPKRKDVKFDLEPKIDKKEKADNPDAEDWTVINKEETSPSAKTVQEHDEKDEGASASGSSQTKPSSRASEGKENSKVHYPNLNLMDEDLSKMPKPTYPPIQTPTHQCVYPLPPQYIAENHPLAANYPRQPPFVPPMPMRPHIVEALNAMTAMGFRNEHGWLTSLLESVNGDIHKALDILQPVRK